MVGVWSPGAAASEGDDTYTGDDTDEIVDGLGGNDVLNGGQGNDTLYGGEGNDVLRPGNGYDTDIAYGGAGDDFISNASQAFGGVGDDIYFGTTPTEYADEGNDSLFVSSTNFSLVGYPNIENLFLAWTFTQSYFSTYLPAIGQNFFANWPGNFYGTSANLTATGNALNNTLVTDSGADTLYGLDGDDLLFGEFGADRLEGGSGDDRLYGGASDDILLGGTGNDTLYGGGGLDSASYADASAAVTIDLGNAGVQNTGGGGLDRLVDVEGAVGSAYGDLLTGSTGGRVIRLSTDLATGLQGHGKNASMQADGSAVAFESEGVLAVGDANGASDIYVRNFFADTITRVSTSSTGQAANGGSYDASLGFYGRSVVFRSDATNLVAGDTNGVSDLFVKNLATGVTTRVSTDANGVQGALAAYGAQLSTNEDKVVFHTASSLMAEDLNNHTDIYVKDLATGAVTLVGPAYSDGSSYDAVFTDTSKKVVFTSAATNLVAGDLNGKSDIFVEDLTTGQLTLISSTADGVQANADAVAASASGSGQFVAFQSAADNLVAGDTNGQVDIFVKNLTTGAITRVSTSATGAQANGVSSDAMISAGGTMVLFTSAADNLVAGDTNGQADVFLKDLTTGAITRVSTGAGEAQGSGASYGGASADFSRIVFESLSGLTTDDANGLRDVYIKDLADTGANTLTGGAGDDVLTGLAGADTLNGGANNDLLVGDDDDASTPDGADILNGDAGVDILIGGGGGDTLNGGTENDLLIGGQGDDTLNGGDGDDVLMTGTGTGEMVGGVARLTSYQALAAGNDTLDGGLGLDMAYLLFAGRSGDIVFDNTSATAKNNITIGGAAAGSAIRVERVYFDGGLGADRITGGSGDDFLRGGAGADVLSGGGGIDTADYGDKTGAVAVWLYLDGVVTVTVDGVAEDTLWRIENVNGGAGADTLRGDDQANTLNGGDGDDLLSGGAGVDVLDGGTGVDTAEYTYMTSSVQVALAGATNATVSVNGVAQDTIRNIENLIGGFGADLLTGDDRNNSLTGASGDDQLLGGDGADVLDGGDGVDTLIGERGDDVLRGGWGDDILRGGLLVLGSLTDGGSDQLYGDAGDDQLFGGDGLAALHGGDGADILRAFGTAGASLEGDAGNDTLYASDGSDTIDGGTGLDTLSYKFGTAGVTLDLAVLVPQNTGGSGTDTVRNIDILEGSSFNDVLSGDGLQGRLLGGEGDDQLSGRAGADTLIGGAGADSLDGGADLDILVGGAGDDILDGGTGGERTPSLLYTGNPAFMAINGGDIADYRETTGGVTVNLALVGPQNTGQGFDTLRNIEDVWGGSVADILTGDDNSNELVGLAGDDQLYGGGGVDLLIGDVGDDVLHGGADADILRGGVLSGLLPDGNDKLYGDAGSDDLMGGTGADWLYGGDDGDLLQGRGGADHLLGEGGSDSLYVDLGDAEVDGGLGDDVIGLSGLSSGESQVLSVLSGGGGDDQIQLDFAAISQLSQTLTLSGGAGQDRLQIYADLSQEGPVVVHFDQIVGRLAFESIETLQVSGVGLRFYGGANSVNVFADAYADILQGGAGADLLVGDGPGVGFNPADDDQLSGQDGDDSLYGGMGHDTLSGGAGNDGLYLNAFNSDDYWRSHGVVDWGLDVLSGGDGYDTASFYYDGAEAAFTFSVQVGAASLVQADGQTVASVDGVERFMFWAGDGDDVLSGGSGTDLFNGGGGRDWLIGAEGADILIGGDGHDSLWGGAGGDNLDGGEGDDTLFGGDGADWASYASAAAGVEVDLSIVEEQQTRGAGVDTLVSIENLQGSDFNDRLTGGVGENMLIGGSGADTFVFNATSFGARDTITDFVVGVDKIDLSEIDADLALVGDQAFHLGATSGHAGDVVIAYGGGVQTSLWLYVDDDAVADVVIVMDGNLALTGADFVL